MQKCTFISNRYLTRFSKYKASKDTDDGASQATYNFFLGIESTRGGDSERTLTDVCQWPTHASRSWDRSVRKREEDETVKIWEITPRFGTGISLKRKVLSIRNGKHLKGKAFSSEVCFMEEKLVVSKHSSWKDNRGYFVICGITLFSFLFYTYGCIIISKIEENENRSVKLNLLWSIVIFLD